MDIYSSDLLILLALLITSIICATISPVMLIRNDLAKSGIITHSSVLAVFLSVAASWLPFVNISMFSLIYIFGMLVSSVFLYINLILIDKLHLRSMDACIFNMALSVACGITLISMFMPGSSVGENVFFGNIEYIDASDVVTLFYICIFLVISTWIMHTYYRITALDKNFAKLIGIRVNLVDLLFVMKLAAAITITCYIFGIVIASSFYMGGTLIARCFSKNMVELHINTFMICFLVSVYVFAISRGFLSLLDVDLNISGLIGVTMWGMACYLKRSIK
ncbi:MAG: metal ABC transporter permease [Chlamydiia bacterium]|nr:metal ABC transporter permease [Chlamydiia bacterium]